MSVITTFVNTKVRQLTDLMDPLPATVLSKINSETRENTIRDSWYSRLKIYFCCLQCQQTHERN